MKDAGDVMRQWRIVLEYYPNPDSEKYQYYWEVREQGNLHDCGYSSDPVIALEDAGQCVSDHL